MHFGVLYAKHLYYSNQHFGWTSCFHPEYKSPINEGSILFTFPNCKTLIPEYSDLNCVDYVKRNKQLWVLTRNLPNFSAQDFTVTTVQITLHCAVLYLYAISLNNMLYVFHSLRQYWASWPSWGFNDNNNNSLNKLTFSNILWHFAKLPVSERHPDQKIWRATGLRPCVKIEFNYLAPYLEDGIMFRNFCVHQQE